MTIFECLKEDHQKVRARWDQMKGRSDDFPVLDVSVAQGLIEEIGIELRAGNKALRKVFLRI
jgi:ribosomal protein S12